MANGKIGRIRIMSSRKKGDHFTRKAKASGFEARSVFKLEEINKRFKVFRKNQNVLDLGCAPGSWTRYASQQIGLGGLCVGIDRSPVNLSMPNVRCLEGDIYEIDASTFSKHADHFDLVMSDMAPDTCGNRFTDHVRSVQLCERALEIALMYLRPRGHFICKIFEGPDTSEFFATVKSHFKNVKRVKPKSTRSESVEFFIVGIERLGSPPPAADAVP